MVSVAVSRDAPHRVQRVANGCGEEGSGEAAQEGGVVVGQHVKCAQLQGHVRRDACTGQLSSQLKSWQPNYRLE